MSVVPAASEPTPAADEAPAVASPDEAVDDRSGRDRLVWNVIASWAGHVVFIVAGFIMPRQIDRHVGQVGLGVWDFGWTTVNYFFLAQIGVGVSVNRYVARYRSARDNDGLSRMISSVVLLQLIAAGIVLALTAASAYWLPFFFREDLRGEAEVATRVIALLGVSVAVRMASQPFSGVVTGCHRWDLHNLLNSGTYGITVLGMLLALWRGGGLVDISVVYLVGTIAGEIIRVGLAFRVCPELKVSPAQGTVVGGPRPHRVRRQAFDAGHAQHPRRAADEHARPQPDRDRDAGRVFPPGRPHSPHREHHREIQPAADANGQFAGGQRAGRGGAGPRHQQHQVRGVPDLAHPAGVCDRGRRRDAGVDGAPVRPDLGADVHGDRVDVSDQPAADLLDSRGIEPSRDGSRRPRWWDRSWGSSPA